MNENCKYCKTAKTCLENADYGSIYCQVYKRIPKVIGKTYDELQEKNKQLKQQNEFLMKQDNILQSLMQWLYKQKEELENIPKDEEMSIEAYCRLNAYRIVLMKIKDLNEEMK